MVSLVVYSLTKLNKEEYSLPRKIDQFFIVVYIPYIVVAVMACGKLTFVCVASRKKLIFLLYFIVFFSIKGTMI